MPDVVTEPVAPAVEPAPVPSPVTPEPTPVVTPVTPEVPQGPLSKSEARRALHQSRQAAEPAPVEPAPVVPAEPVAAEPTPGESAPVTPASAEPAVATPEPIVVAVPEGHPLREMGRKEFLARDESEARALRALLNSHVRRQDVIQRDKTIAELQEWKLRREAEEAARGAWEKTPEAAAVQQRYHELREQYGDEDANAYLRGVMEKLEAAVEAEYGKRSEAVNLERAQQAAQDFTNRAWERALQLDNLRDLPEFPGMFRTALEDFNALVRGERVQGVQRGDVDGLLDAFTKHFAAYLTRQPAVAAAFQRAEARKQEAAQAAADAAAARERELEAIRKQAVDEHLKSLANKRQATPPNPLATMQPAPQGDRTPTPSSDEDLAKLGPVQFRKAQRRLAREDSRARFGG